MIHSPSGRFLSSKAPFSPSQEPGKTPEKYPYCVTGDAERKKRLAAYAGQHPEQCRQTDADPETGSMEFDIEKGRFSFRLTAPYSKERREAARQFARENNAADRLK